MTGRPVRPIPPKNFEARACDPLDHGDGSLCIDAVKRMLGPANHLSEREQRSVGMAAYPIENLPAWIRHHLGEVWSNFSCFVAQGGVLFEPETDNPKDVCAILASMPEKWLNRLEPSFVGLEREADPDGFFRMWFSAIHRRFLMALEVADAEARADYQKRCRLYQRVLKDLVPDFAQLFDSAREFIGYAACNTWRWVEGDSAREEWDLARFEVKVRWRGVICAPSSA